MRALQFTEYGSREVLSWGDAPEPHAGPGQMRIAVRSPATTGAPTAPLIAQPRPRQPRPRERLSRQVAGRPLDPGPQPSVHGPSVPGVQLCEGGRVVARLTQQDGVTALVVCVTRTHHNCVTPAEDQLLPLLPESPELPLLPAPGPGLVLGASLLSDHIGQSET
jgi:hypothetical protein